MIVLSFELSSTIMYRLTGAVVVKGIHIQRMSSLIMFVYIYLINHNFISFRGTKEKCWRWGCQYSEVPSPGFVQHSVQNNDAHSVVLKHQFETEINTWSQQFIRYNSKQEVPIRWYSYLYFAFIQEKQRNWHTCVTEHIQLLLSREFGTERRDLL